MTLNQAQSPSRRLEPGTTFDGRYWIISHIGSGGMATVYKVKHLHLEQLAALKLLRRDMCNDPRSVKRFKREAKAASAIQHANLVNVQGFGIADGTPYLVMDYVEGDSLDMILDAGGAMPAARVIDAARQIAAALGFLHQHHIVHRDVKPGNVIATADGVYKVVDFGVAKMENPDDPEQTDNQSLTKTGAIVGTPTYMSPEQSMGREVDGRSDIYSLGCLLFELATGKPPYEAESHYAMLAQHLKGKIPSAADTVASFEHEALDEVMQKCLAKEPAERYQTMEELVEALNVCELRVPGTGGATKRFVTKWSKKYAGNAVLSAAFCCVAVGLGATALFLVSLPDKQAVTATAPEEISVEQLMARGKVAQIAKEDAKALSYHLRALKQIETNPHASLYQRAEAENAAGVCYMNLIQPREALPHLLRAEEIYQHKEFANTPQLGDVQFYVGQAYSWMQQWGDAARALERSHQNGNSSWNVDYVLAQSLLFAGRVSEEGGAPYPWESASDQENNPRKGFSWQGKPWGSLAVGESVVPRVPAETKVDALDTVAASYARLHRYAEAERCILKARQYPGGILRSNFRIAMIRLAQGRLADAKALTLQVSADPVMKDAVWVKAGCASNFGLIAYREGKFTESAKYFDDAYRLMVRLLPAQRPSDVTMVFESILGLQHARDAALQRARGH